MTHEFNTDDLRVFREDIVREFEAEEEQYHWDAEGEPANEATAALRESDLGSYFRLRPALGADIGTIRMSEIMRDSGLGVSTDGYTKIEKLFRARLDEENEWIASQGLIPDWKLDNDLP